MTPRACANYLTNIARWDFSVTKPKGALDTEVAFILNRQIRYHICIKALRTIASRICIASNERYPKKRAATFYAHHCRGGRLTANFNMGLFLGREYHSICIVLLLHREIMVGVPNPNVGRRRTYKIVLDDGVSWRVGFCAVFR